MYCHPSPLYCLTVKVNVGGHGACLSLSIRHLLAPVQQRTQTHNTQHVIVHSYNPLQW
jgi:hypothetical protein